MNRTSKRLIAMMTVAIALLPAAAGRVAPAEEPKAPPSQEKERSASFWMERKLHLSKDLLAGITAADFDQVAASAQAMRGLNKVEAFVRSRTPGYRTQLQIFDESLAEIVKQADKDNVEGAALAFTQLTISCVNCHKQIRAVK
jgi:hypothetical protein